MLSTTLSWGTIEAFCDAIWFWTVWWSARDWLCTEGLDIWRSFLYSPLVILCFGQRQDRLSNFWRIEDFRQHQLVLVQLWASLIHYLPRSRPLTSAASHFLWIRTPSDLGDEWHDERIQSWMIVTTSARIFRSSIWQTTHDIRFMAMSRGHSGSPILCSALRFLLHSAFCVYQYFLPLFFCVSIQTMIRAFSFFALLRLSPLSFPRLPLGLFPWPFPRLLRLSHGIHRVHDNLFCLFRVRFHDDCFCICYEIIWILRVFAWTRGFAWFRRCEYCGSNVEVLTVLIFSWAFFCDILNLYDFPWLGLTVGLNLFLILSRFWYTTSWSVLSCTCALFRSSCGFICLHSSCALSLFFDLPFFSRCLFLWGKLPHSPVFLFFASLSFSLF